MSASSNTKKMRRIIRRKPLILIAGYYALALLVTALLVCSNALPAKASGSITGLVFRDYNANGRFDDTGTGGDTPSFREIGVGGVTVTAYDSTNTAVGSTTSSTSLTTPGLYTLNVVTAQTQVRVEFTGLPAGYQPGPAGIDSGTTVQFVNVGAANVNVGINKPNDYCQTVTTAGAATNPRLVTPCYLFGDALDNTNPNYNSDAVVQINYAPSTTGDPVSQNLYLAKFKDVGAVYGVAYQRYSKSVFTSAFQKRHMSYGPQGTGSTGGIYRIDRSNELSPVVSNFLDLNTITGINTGTNPHPSGTTDYTYDSNSFAAATKVGLGDLEISDDEKTLFTVNLATQEVLVIPLGSNPASPVAPTTLGSGATDIKKIAIPAPVTGNAQGASQVCGAAADVRSFGLGFNDGLLYVGMVCTAQTSQNASEVRGYVYTFNPTSNTFGAAPVLEFPLTYNKGLTYTVPANSFPDTGSVWKPWVDTIVSNNGTRNFQTGDSYVYPQPILSDISFFNGDMMVSIRDRNGDQTGAFTPPPFATDLSIVLESISVGENLRSSPSTSTPNQWIIENNSQNGTGARAFGPTTGAGNNQGPGGGEFYWQDQYRAIHNDTSLGSVAQIPGSTELTATSVDPLNTNPRSGGVRWYSNDTGARARTYQIYIDTSGNNRLNFEKANGLGDIEAICNAAPIEIGNRVWRDDNTNGIQDPNEAGIAGVIVRLYENGTLTPVGTAVTDANGSYLFNDANVTNGGTTGVKPNTAYEVRIDPTDTFGANSNVTSLAGLFLTAANVGGPTGSIPDMSDSDGVLNASVATVSLTTGAAGVNDHTFDFGYDDVQPTRMRLAHFQAQAGASQTTIDWTTGSEVDNLGFNLYFQPVGGKELKLNSDLIPSQGVTSHSPLDYQFSTPNRGAGGYILEDVSVSGQTVRHGPYQLGQEVGLKLAGPDKVGARPDLSQPAKSGLQPAVANLSDSTQAVNLQTGAAGTYRLSYEYLTSLGVNFNGVAPAKLSLRGPRGGVPLKISVANQQSLAPGDYIEFEAAAFHSVYSDYNNYVLSLGGAGSLAPTLAPPTTDKRGRANPGNRQIKTDRIEQNGFYWAGANLSEDPWFWDFLATASPTLTEKDFTFDLPQLVGSQATSLKVHVHGMYDDQKLNPDHRIVATLNGVALGQLNFDGKAAAVLSAAGPLPVQAIGNKLHLKLEKVNSTNYLALFDYLELDYQQSDSPVKTTLPGGVRPRLQNPLDRSNPSDYLIIGHPALMNADGSALQQLISLRQAEGFKVRVVNVFAIYDYYSQGRTEATAIRSYLDEQSKYSPLKYVLLVGGDSNDPMNYKGQVGKGNSLPSFVPSLYFMDSYGVRSPTDVIYSRGDTPNSTVKFSIGRFPAQSQAELNAMVSKTVQLSGMVKTNTLSKRAVFVSDDDSAEFRKLSDDLAAASTGYNVQKNYLGVNGLDVNQLRNDLSNEINTGSAWVNYVGHSGNLGWGNESLWNRSNVQTLANSANPLVVMQWGCYSNYFSDGNYRSIGETWLSGNTGAALVLGATAESLTSEQSELAGRLYQKVLSQGKSMGQAMLESKAEMMAAKPGLKDVDYGFIILGDPALKLK